MEAISGSPSSSLLKDQGVYFRKLQMLAEGVFPELNGQNPVSSARLWQCET